LRFGPSLSSVWQSSTQRAVWFTSSTDEIGVDGSDTGSGSLTGTQNPANVAYLINWAISGTYRGGHPRTYLCGVAVSTEASSTTLTSTERTNLTTAANGFLSDVNALTHGTIASVTLGTVAFFQNNSALAPPVFKPYLSGSASPKFATQRRRVRR
jgi:hypothetical protein